MFHMKLNIFQNKSNHLRQTELRIWKNYTITSMGKHDLCKESFFW
jgi:hypothetical protein